MTLFPEKIQFSRRKFLTTFFIKCRIRPFLHQKNHYFGKEFLDSTISFTLFVFSRSSDNTTSLNNGRDRCMGRPPPHGPSPSPPRSPPLLSFYSRRDLSRVKYIDV